MSRSGDIARRPLTYLRRARRGLSLLQEVGRTGLFRVENRVSIARLDYEAADIYLHMDSKYTPMRIRACAKEPWTVEWLERWLRPGDVLYDIGANVGAYSLIAASLGAQVVAVEPAFSTFSSLCDNIVLNDARAAVIPLSIVLGSTTGLDRLNYRALEPGAGLHSVGDRPFLKGDFDPVYRQPVLSYRLDDLLAQFPLRRPDHLKIDVDGFEPDVLRGAGDTLGAGYVQTVMIEVNADESGEVTKLLLQYGLELHSRYDPPSANGHWYGLFARGRGAS